MVHRCFGIKFKILFLKKTAESVMRITGISTGVVKLYQTATCVLSV
jgi:hypothetical protein